MESEVEQSYFDDGKTSMEAALAAARYGLRVFPTHPVTKDPMPGYAWKELASSSVNHVVEDFTRAAEMWGDEVGVGWACGVDGFVAIDLDTDDWPDWVADIIGDAAINVTKRGQHLVFRFPTEFEPGNTDTKFPTTGWGEVRGKGGYIVIAGPDRPGLNVDDLAQARPFPQPEWLAPYGGGAEAVDWKEVAEFAKRHTAANTPTKLDGIRSAIESRSPDHDGDPSKGRHPFAVWAMTTVAEEALAGHYPFADGFQVIRQWWHDATPPERHGRELRGITCWAVAKALQNAAPSPAVDDDRTPAERWAERLLTPEQVMALEPPEYIVDKHIPEGSLTMMVGPSGSGKSFVALDISMKVATGGGFWGDGRDVKAGRVLYVAAEGSAGFGKRYRAWCKHHGIEATTAAISLLPEPVALFHTPSVDIVVEALREVTGAYDLVVIDTLARSTTGANENDASDAGVVITNLERIKGAAGDAAVLIVHHTGKDIERGARGSSAYYAAMDAEITVTTIGGVTKQVRTKTTKMKDDVDELETYFRGQVVELVDGLGLDDEVPSSLVLVHLGAEHLEAVDEERLDDVHYAVLGLEKYRNKPISQRMAVQAMRECGYRGRDETARAALETAVYRGFVVEVEGPRKARLYQYVRDYTGPMTAGEWLREDTHQVRAT